MQNSEEFRPRVSVHFKRSSTGKAENDGYEIYVAESFHAAEVDRIKKAAKELRDWAEAEVKGKKEEPSLEESLAESLHQVAHRKEAAANGNLETLNQTIDQIEEQLAK